MVSNRPEKTPWNPSVRATARVPESQHHAAPTECPYCSGQVSIVHHRDIYHGRSYGDWPWMYVCDNCGARVGMHPFTAIPLGTLADKALLAARTKCKPAFEWLWKEGGWDRGMAYKKLAEAMAMTPEQCHWGQFNVEQCHAAQTICLHWREIGWKVTKSGTSKTK